MRIELELENQKLQKEIESLKNKKNKSFVLDNSINIGKNIHLNDSSSIHISAKKKMKKKKKKHMKKVVKKYVTSGVDRSITEIFEHKKHHPHSTHPSLFH